MIPYSDKYLYENYIPEKGILDIISIYLDIVECYICNFKMQNNDKIRCIFCGEIYCDKCGSNFNNLSIKCCNLCMKNCTNLQCMEKNCYRSIKHTCNSNMIYMIICKKCNILVCEKHAHVIFNYCQNCYKLKYQYKS